MIARVERFGIDSRFIEVMYDAKKAMNNWLIEIRKEIAKQKAIDEMKGKRFIPIKVPISRNYNSKHHKLTIRNQLPQRIRTNEKAEI